MNIKNNKTKYSKGFSMFVSIIVMGVLVLVTFSVINLSVKETQFSNLNRESQYALFAADAGIECAIYWDSKVVPSAFATSTTGTISCAGNNNITTNSQVIPTPPTPVLPNSLVGGGGNASPTSIFYLMFNNGSNPVSTCAVVTVRKNNNGSTYIASKGYNNCNTSDPKRVERGIEVTY